MGIFRKHKASRYSARECRVKEDDLKERIADHCSALDPDIWDFTEDKALDRMLAEWAEWRECRARIEGENETTEDTR